MLQFVRIVKNDTQDVSRLLMHNGGKVRLKLLGIRGGGALEVTSSNARVQATAGPVRGTEARVVIEVPPNAQAGEALVTARVRTAAPVSRRASSGPGVAGGPAPRGGDGRPQGTAAQPTLVEDVDTLGVRVEPLPVMPPEDSEAGILARMFLSEVRGPANEDFDPAVARQNMQWMKVVLTNRLRAPQEFMAPNAVTLTDMIKSSNTVHGFRQYPVLATDVETVINQTLAIAADDGDLRQAGYLELVRIAIEQSRAPLVKDPCKPGLFGWRTEGHGSPGANFEVYQNLGKNTFYTLKQAHYDSVEGLGKPRRR